jgi:hypothetical protein
MILLMLPADASRILSGGKPFLEASLRVVQVPMFRTATSETLPDKTLWNEMLRLPLLVLMVGETLPMWMGDLAARRPVAVLSRFESAVNQAHSIEGVVPGLLVQKQDLREFYRVARELSALLAKQELWPEETRTVLRSYAAQDLFAARSRLAFLPPLGLPDPDSGRPSAYLYNRLSNNVDDPALFAKTPEGSSEFFRVALRWGLEASRALSLVELGVDVPPSFPVPREELAKIHAELTAESDDQHKRNLMMELGRRIAMSDRKLPQFVTAAVPRRDLLLGRVPEGVRLDPNHEELARPGLKALRDMINRSTKSRPTKQPAQAAYDRARQTLIFEERLLACHTACLSSRCHATPFQLGVVRNSIYGDVSDLNGAIDANSRKVAQLFRRVELNLSSLLPAELLARMAQADSATIFYSDLPFEWTAVDGWPLCLTKPVSRIPVGLARWDVLSAILESGVAVDTRTPGRVLVLDLISQHDEIRVHSDSFIAASESLKQHYTYASPCGAAELRMLLERSQADVVVLDAHGSYNRRTDSLEIGFQDKGATIDEILPHKRVPPVWILSACDTSITGAMRGCFVRTLLAKGAACVIATLARVDAFTASMFVGRLLTEIYNPMVRGRPRTLDEVFFDTQFTTALVYDPLLPLFRKSATDLSLKKPLGRVLGDYFAWAQGARLGPREFRHAAALVLDEVLKRYGLADFQAAAERAGQLRPETLLFSAFGAPSRVDLTE